MIKEINYKDTYPIRQQAMYPDRAHLVPVEGDSLAKHFGYFKEDLLVSVISVFDIDADTQLRKFATLPNEQNKGYGSKLLNYVLSITSGRIILNARDEKKDFYKKFGFNETKDKFERNGLNYTIMELIK